MGEQNSDIRVLMWHDEWQRFLDTGKLDPADECLCDDCVEGRECKEDGRKS